MSGVDDNNISQFNSNVMGMIDSQLQRIKSTQSKPQLEDTSIEEIKPEEEKTPHTSNINSKTTSNMANHHQSPNKSEDSEDEFFDCLDNQKDLEMLNQDSIKRKTDQNDSDSEDDQEVFA
jgi:hypothetical protein